MKPEIPSQAELIASIDTAWQDLRAFLSAVPPSQASRRDHAGWSVTDHVTHMAVWEDSVAVLFRGGRRHEALGIEETVYAAGSFDQINEMIRLRFQAAPLAQAVHQLEQVHREFVSHIAALADADLKTAVRDFFPQAPRTDDRPLFTLIYDNTAGHFVEHLEWIRELTGPA